MNQAAIAGRLHPLARRLGAALDAVPASIALLDKRGVIVSVNAAWQRFALANGLRSRDFGVGQDYPGLCDGVAGGCAENAGQAAGGIRSVLDGQVGEVSFEYPCHSPAEERWFRMTVTPLAEEASQDAVAGAVVMHVDISERKRAEFSELFRQTDALLVVLDSRGRVESVNPAFARATGWSSTELASSNLQGLSTLIPLQLRRSHERRDGSSILVDWSVSPIFGKEGQLLSHVCIGRDVTREHQVQEALRQNDKLRSTATLAGGIAHDFNNLLGAINGLTELCQLDAPVQSRLARNLDRIGQAGGKAAALVRQLLDFSRQMPMATQHMRVSELLAHAEGLLRAALPAEVALSVRIDDDGPLCIDLVQIDQVLLNLTRNAAHAMRGRCGEVRIVADRADPPAETVPDQRLPAHLRLRVIDTGEGMEPKLLSKIFKPFFTTKPVGEGTGLGLAAVHGIVGNHGGVVEVCSQPGLGTTFCVYLPWAALPIAPPGAATPIPASIDHPLSVSCAKIQ